MKLKIENVGKIKQADIDLNGITVIAGNNSTGKSTVSKSLYTIVKCFYKFSESIERERKKKCAAELKEWSGSVLTLLEKCKNKTRKTLPVEKRRGMISHINFHMKTFENFRSDICYNSSSSSAFNKLYISMDSYDSFRRIMEEYLKLNDMLHGLEEGVIDTNLKNLDKMLIVRYEKMVKLKSDDDLIKRKLMNDVTNYMTYPLSSQFNTLDASAIKFEMSINDQAYIEKTEATENFYFEPIEVTTDIVYIQPKHILDEAEDFFLLENDINEEILKSQIRKRTIKETEEGYTSEEIKLINGVLIDILNIIRTHNQNSEYKEPIGEISRDEDIFFESIKYQDNELNAPIPFSVVASGIKNMVIIKRLIANGTLKENTFLIIDEPEVNLHPEWQLIFAEILVMLRKQLGIIIMINTHSPYFMRAIECYCDEYDLMEDLDIYTTEKEKASDFQYVLCNVSLIENGISELYYNMSRPLAMLQNMIDQKYN